MPGRSSTVVCAIGVVLFGVFVAVDAFAADGRQSVGDDPPAAYSTNELRAALLYGSYRDDPGALRSDRRSVPLALGMSALLPGLGQAYNDDWIKGAAAFVIEAGLIAGYLIWRNKGLEQEEAYVAYAHDYWSAGQYANWLNDYVDYLETEHDAAIDVDPIEVPAGIDFYAPEGWNEQDRRVVHDFFDRIRAVEGQVFHPETDASFSHKLPYFGEQQYYELIGKYFQFAPGWVDYPDWRVGGEFTQAIDPERSGPGGTRLNVQGRFLEYAEDHADANTLLRRASRISAAILFNHVISAVDAGISAKLHNDRLDTDVTLNYDVSGRPSLLATARWRF